MLPEFYHKCLSKLLTTRQYATLRIIVIILQSYRTIQIEKLAALLPIPIKYESRRRHLQRLLLLPQLTPKCIWFPILKKWLKVNHKKNKKKRENEGWYLITNLSSLQSAVKAYKKRMGIEAMFKDCKSGGYNLEKCLGTDKRLLSLILLIAIAYTSTIKKGKKIAFMGIKQYVCRLKENFRKDKRHSNFWVGLYGGLWVETFKICHHWVEQLMILTPNKLPFYQKGLRAKELIQSAF